MDSRHEKDFIHILPVEIWLDIIALLNPKEILTLGLVCRFFDDLSKDNGIWKQKYVACFHEAPNPKRDSLLSSQRNLTLFKNNLYVAFSQAIKTGDVVKIIKLLNLGLININRPLNIKRETFLMQAVCKANVEIVNLLLQHGADLSCVDAEGNTPHRMAETLQRDHFQCPKLASIIALLDHAQAIVAAAAEGKVDDVIALLAAGASPNLRNRYGCTALSAAAGCGNILLAQKLIAAGADVNTKNNLDDTPLMIASMKGNIEMVKFLLENKADPLLRDDSNRTARDYAIDSNLFAILDEAMKHKETENLFGQQMESLRINP